MAKVTVTKQIIHKRLDLKSGDQVVTTISNQANVLLMDDVNFSLFKSGKSFRHAAGGGYFTTSPATLIAPSTGGWNLVIDLPNGGRISHSITVLRKTA